MAPASRILWLLAAHCGLAWMMAAAAAAASATAADSFVSIAFASASLVLTSSQIVVGGIVAGLLSDPSRSERHALSRALTWLFIGLPSISLPIVFLLSLAGGGDLVFFLSYLFGSWMAVGCCAVVTALTLAAFNLCPTDEPIIEKQSAPRRIQFSLRQLIGLTTLIAVACAVPHWLANRDSLLGALAVVYLVVLGVVSVIGGLWLLTVGIPVGAILTGRHPWRNAVLGIGFAGSIVCIAMLVLIPQDWASVPWWLLILVGGHLVVTMSSLAVLRSCGLRLVRCIPDETLPARVVNADFPTRPFDDRPPIEAGKGRGVPRSHPPTLSPSHYARIGSTLFCSSPVTCTWPAASMKTLISLRTPNSGR
jgi:hypothetical protein